MNDVKYAVRISIPLRAKSPAGKPAGLFSYRITPVFIRLSQILEFSKLRIS